MLPSLRKISTRPKNPKYPRELFTLGDHLRTKRLDLGLEQKDVAKIVKVTFSTISNWENHRSEPVIQHYPAIMEFLGYCLYQYPETYGDRLRLHRIHRGLSYRKLARILGVDPGSISGWETEAHRPLEKSQKKIDRFVGDYK